jgi:beta-glucosidase
VLTTVASSAAEHVPAATNVQYAALDSKSLIETSTLGPAQQQMIDEAVAAANSSDVVIAVLGDTMATCGEGTDRVDLVITCLPLLSVSLSLARSFSMHAVGLSQDLPGVQMQLLAALVATRKPIVLVLVHGRPVTFGRHNALLDGVSVVLASWIGGEEHGPAIWSIINGDFNPSGRLAQTWPRSVGYVGTHADSRYGPLGLFQGVCVCVCVCVCD